MPRSAENIRAPSVTLPVTTQSPANLLLQRLAAALGLITFVALVAYVGGDGYSDGDERGGITIIDAFYYASVSVTTTGYGDITPVTDGARLATTLLVTPARILFLILLVGTTVEVLAESSRELYRRKLWRRRLHDHTIVCGYGTKGRSAIATLTARGVAPGRIVVVDRSPDAIAEATRDGFAAVHGQSTRMAVLEEAGIREAASVIIATHADETSILTTLTARELNKGATIVAAVREDENRHLLHESGADSVIVSSGAAGRILGLATGSPRLAEVLEDLMTVGTGMDIIEVQAAPEDVGKPLYAASATHGGAPVVAVVRRGEVLRFDDDRAQTIEAGDRVVSLCSHQKRHRG